MKKSNTTIKNGQIWTVGPKTQEKLSEGATSSVTIEKVDDLTSKIVVIDSNKQKQTLSVVNLSKFISDFIVPEKITPLAKATKEPTLAIKKGDNVLLKSGFIGQIVKYSSNVEITIQPPTDENGLDTQKIICSKIDIEKVIA